MGAGVGRFPCPAVMSGSLPQRQPRSRARRIVDVIRLVVGLVGFFVAAWWVGLASNALPHVLSVVQHVYEPTESLATKVAMTVVMALCMAVVTGAWVVGRVDVGQALAAVWVGVLLFASVWLLYSVQFSGPDAVCALTSCWPAPYQQLMVAAPVALAAIAMGSVAIAGRPSRVSVRAALPGLALLILTLLQQIMWRSLALPILIGPPPT